jgi:hypothetical protein
MVLLIILKNILLASLGERVVAKAFFGIAAWLASRTEATNLDDDLVAEWKAAYYEGRV